jgi:hypothetical protein
VLVLAVVVDGDDLGLVDCKRREMFSQKWEEEKRNEEEDAPFLS